MKAIKNTCWIITLTILMCACVPGGDVVQVQTVTSKEDPLKGLDEEDLARLAEIKRARQEADQDDQGLKNMIQETQNYSVQEYLALNPQAGSPLAHDYRIGGYDVLDIVVYEEEDLTRENVRVSADGFISFPLIGRVKVDRLNTSEVENRISSLLARGQFVLDAHVSVTVTEYRSKQYMVLGSVKEPGTYPLRAQERVLDAISEAKGIDFEQGGKQGMIIRTLQPNTDREKKIVVRIDLTELLKGGDQLSNLLLTEKDLLYIPKADYFYIIGQVEKPGSYPYIEKQITIVEAISKAGGFTKIAAPNRTRVIRVEDGVEKIIRVQVDAITKAGQKAQDIPIVPGDVIVVPESFF